MCLDLRIYLNLWKWKNKGFTASLYLCCISRTHTFTHCLFALHWTVYSAVVNCIEVCVFSGLAGRREGPSSTWKSSVLNEMSRSFCCRCAHAHTNGVSLAFFSSLDCLNCVWSLVWLRGFNYYTSTWKHWPKFLSFFVCMRVFVCVCARTPFILSLPRRGESYKCSHACRTEEAENY